LRAVRGDEFYSHVIPASGAKRCVSRDPRRRVASAKSGANHGARARHFPARFSDEQSMMETMILIAAVPSARLGGVGAASAREENQA